MLLPMIRTIDPELNELVECAVIWEDETTYTVRCLHPHFFDPNSWFDTKTFRGNWWRIQKSDAELLDKTFDTIVVIRRARLEAEVCHFEHHVHLSGILTKLRQLTDRLCVIAAEQPGKGGDSPVSHFAYRLEEPPLACDLGGRLLSSTMHGMGSNESRLNGRGLKMWTYVTKLHDGSYSCYVGIGGDQEEDYPGFVTEARKVIAELGLNTIP